MMRDTPVMKTLPARSAQDALLAARRALSPHAEALLAPLLSHDTLSDLTEPWLKELYTRHLPKSARASTIVYALGSLARRELCLHSDVDVLIEVHDPSLLDEEAFVHALSLVLHEARAHRIRLKQIVRTRAQHLEELHKDWRTPISLLDARAILSPARATVMNACVRTEALDFLRQGKDQGTSFVDRLVDAHLKRRARQDQTIYLLEPDLKLGLGALRDLHTIHWACLVRLGETPLSVEAPEQGWTGEERAIYTRARSWLLALRMHVHSLHRSAQDRLRFDDQRRIAQRLYPLHAHPIERLMREHYEITREGLRLLERTLRRWSARYDHDTLTLHACSKKLGVHEAKLFSPTQSLKALARASSQQKRLDPDLEAALMRSCASWSPEMLTTPWLQRQLLELLTSLTTSTITSTRMLELGLLERFIPEFAPLICHVQHDTYHVYTTDVHTLKCLERARTLLRAPGEDAAAARWPAFTFIAQKIEDTQLLLLAALFHDIGKNRGGDHSRQGADLIPPIAKRLDLLPTRAKTLEFLVRHHLLLSNTSRRLDISDGRVLEGLAARIQSTRMLALLTTLTFCDMSTVSDTAMNDWRAHLLVRLHYNLEQMLLERTESMLEGSHAPQHGGWSTERLHSALTHYGKTSSPPREETIARFVHDLPHHALDHLGVDIVHALFSVYRAHLFDPSSTSIMLLPLYSLHDAQETSSPVEQETFQLILCTGERPGLLADIAGVLSANSLNILSAQLISTRSELVLDLFHVDKARDVLRYSHAPPPDFSASRQRHLIEQLHEVLDHGASARSMLEQMTTQRPERRVGPQIAPKVIVHQRLSERYTVLELHGPDRQGLLHDIARALHRLGIEVRFSKLDLLGHRAIDTFYVERMLDGVGQKLTSSQIEMLEQELLPILGER